MKKSIFILLALFLVCKSSSAFIGGELRLDCSFGESETKTSSIPSDPEVNSVAFYVTVFSDDDGYQGDGSYGAVWVYSTEGTYSIELYGDTTGERKHQFEWPILMNPEKHFYYVAMVARASNYGRVRCGAIW